MRRDRDCELQRALRLLAEDDDRVGPLFPYAAPAKRLRCGPQWGHETVPHTEVDEINVRRHAQLRLD